MNKLKYIYFISLGCSKNFVDTEIMAAELIQNGFGLTSNKDEASVCIINTCAFIPPARVEAQDNIQKFLLWKEEKKTARKLIVTGCLTQWDKRKVYPEKYPDVDLWMGLEEIPYLPKKLSLLYDKSQKLDTSCKVICDYKPTYLYDENTPRMILSGASHAFIKISDGCNNRCSYCSIPSIRGDLRSRNIKSVVSEAKNILNSGIKELIVIAQDITAFSIDKNGSEENLTKLIKELDKFEGNYWVRLHYLHPKGITDEFIDAIKNAKHVIPYLDIPLQHISDPILKAMNRKIDKKHILNVLLKLRKIEDMVIRTTFLVGFPGETEENFNELLDFIEEQKFERVGVFPFYLEPGTQAALLPHQVPEKTAKERAEVIQKIHAENSLKFNSNLVGKTFDVILDSAASSYAIGRTFMDSPDIDNTVSVHAPKGKVLKAGKFVKIKVNDYSAFELKGSLI